MKHVSDFPRNIVEYPDMEIRMPDGCRLSARVWMPEDALENPVPVILEHLPYRKRDGTIERDQFSHPWMAGQGYCCIRTDMRGNGDSDGLMADEYTEQELQDACDVIAWAASQPWCNGNVGMQGISWGGFNSLQVASLQPPALKAIITVCSTVDRYADDIHYKGGCLLLENFGWSNTMLSYSSRPPDPALVGNKWVEMWQDRLEHMPVLWKVWHSHQHRDAYWKHGSVCEDYGAINAAVLSVGGWHDGYRNTISHLVKNLSVPVKGIVGPWNHKYPHYAGPKPAIGFLQESKQWWDRWLKDVDNGADALPVYRAYVMDSMKPERWFDERPGRWIAEDTWPSETVSQITYQLGQNRLEPDPEPITCGLSVSSPCDCGLSSGEFFPFAFSDELPDEQSADDALSLCFDGDPVYEPTDIVGAPVVTFAFRADKPQAQLAVRLCDLRPDGTSALITYGVLNLTHRRSHEVPEPLNTGHIEECEFVLDHIAYALPAGHRLRLAISTVYWPYLWPSPETATVTVERGAVKIPVRERVGGPDTPTDEWHFEEPIGAPKWQTKALRAAHYSRDISTNRENGMVTLMIDCDQGEEQDLEHGLVSGARFREKYDIHPNDPLTAKATAQWEQTGGRPGQMWRTEVDSKMTCDAENFYYTASFAAYLEDKKIFEKTFNEKVARQLV